MYTEDMFLKMSFGSEDFDTILAGEGLQLNLLWSAVEPFHMKVEGGKSVDLLRADFAPGGKTKRYFPFKTKLSS